MAGSSGDSSLPNLQSLLSEAFSVEPLWQSIQSLNEHSSHGVLTQGQSGIGSLADNSLAPGACVDW